MLRPDLPNRLGLPDIRVAYIALEFMRNGDVFDWLRGGAFNERICRYYFKQILAGLHAIHQRIIAHRDIKPENLLMDDNFNIKIADFGLSAPLDGRPDAEGNQDGILHSQNGTVGY